MLTWRRLLRLWWHHVAMPTTATRFNRQTGLSLITAVGWLTLGLSGVALALRYTDTSRSSLLAIAGLNPAIALLLIPVTIWAVAAKRGALLTASVLLGVAQIWTNTPLDAISGCGDARGDNDIVIVASNVYFVGATADTVANMLIDADADVVVLTEVQPYFYEQLIRVDEINERFPYRLAKPDPSPAGIAVLSRYKLSEEQPVGQYALRSVVATPAGEFVFQGVHGTAPVHQVAIASWRRELNDMTSLAQSDERPVVLAGDFNATEDHVPFRELLAETTDAADVASCGWGATWPTDRAYPPLLRLDHVLVNDSVKAVDLDTIALQASDHLALRAVVRLVEVTD